MPCFQGVRLWKKHLLSRVVNTYESSLDRAMRVQCTAHRMTRHSRPPFAKSTRRMGHPLCWLCPTKSKAGGQPRDVKSARCCHRLAQSFLGIGSPVTAFELDKD